MLKIWAGRWVKFSDEKNLFPKAHHASDGSVVGIVNGNGLIAVVDGNGENLMLDIPDAPPQQALVTVVYARFLMAVLDRADIPTARLVNTDPNWQPRRD